MATLLHLGEDNLLDDLLTLLHLLHGGVDTDKLIHEVGEGLGDITLLALLLELEARLRQHGTGVQRVATCRPLLNDILADVSTHTLQLNHVGRAVLRLRQPDAIQVASLHLRVLHLKEPRIDRELHRYVRDVHLACGLDIAEVVVIHHHVDAGGDAALITGEVLIEQGLHAALLLHLHVSPHAGVIDDTHAVGQLNLLVDHRAIGCCLIENTFGDSLVGLREKPRDDWCHTLQNMSFEGVGVPVLREADGRIV